MQDVVVQIHPEDDVAVALQTLTAGATVRAGGATLVVREDIPAGHKLALRDLETGRPVRKYGHIIGVTTGPVAAGAWVHTHNLRTALEGKLTYHYNPVRSPLPYPVPESLPKTFSAYVRPDGQVGVRNEIWVLNTVGCVNKVAEQLARTADMRWRGKGVDGVYHFPHPYGCSQLGDDLGYTQKLLAGLVRHPNAAGVLILGLGCENNRIAEFRRLLAGVPEEKVRFLELQSVVDEMEAGLNLIDDLAAYARQFQRQEVPVSALRLGLKCGGSDGFSGITANPLVGVVADWLVALGGTALLTEVPEMFGAETILMQRAVNEATFQRVVELINGFKDYYTRHGQPIYENPSPGNKDGGITTLEEKSLGCIQKGGACPVTDVIAYGDPARQPGLTLVQSPGNDMVSVSALAAAGAHVVLFTTGRGTPMGGPVPTVKVSSNSDLAQRKRGWIDFDAGRLAQGTPMPELAEELYRFVLDVASGVRETRNERNGFREIAIFKDGVTL